MASLSHLACCSTRCSSSTKIMVQGKFRLTRIKVDESGIAKNRGFRCGVAPRVENGHVVKRDLGQGVIVDGGKYRQSYIIRSTEVGADKNATFDSILQLIQETGVNHIGTMGIYYNEYGATQDMISNNLIWVVTRMQVEVDHYPTWGEKVDVETWIIPSTKNSFQRDSLLRSNDTGLVLARAASVWVVMNQMTRRLAKIPETVRTDFLSLCTENESIEHVNEKMEKLDFDKAEYVISNLKMMDFNMILEPFVSAISLDIDVRFNILPVYINLMGLLYTSEESIREFPKITDLDSNYHVNNVKYVRWIMEVIPSEILDKYQLSSVVLEFRKECGGSDVVESLCSPHENEVHMDGLKEQMKYTHLLQIKGETKTEEILRARTTWIKRNIIAQCENLDSKM